MLTSFMICFLIGVTASASLNKTCTRSGIQCVFPFTYASKQYNSCIAGTLGKWCGIKPNITTSTENVNWSYCEDCPKSPQIECTTDGYQCAWPYIDEHGHNHTSCLYYKGWLSRYYWCPVIHGYSGGPEHGQCAETCPNETKIYTTTPVPTTSPALVSTKNPKIFATTTTYTASTHEDHTTNQQIDKTAETTKATEVSGTQSTPKSTQEPLSSKRTTKQPITSMLPTPSSESKTSQADDRSTSRGANVTGDQEGRNEPDSIATQSTTYAPNHSKKHQTQINDSTQATIPAGSNATALILTLMLVFAVAILIAVGVLCIRKRRNTKATDEQQKEAKFYAGNKDFEMPLAEKKQSSGEMKSSDPTEDTTAPLMVDESSPTKVQYVTTDSGFGSRGDFPQT